MWTSLIHKTLALLDEIGQNIFKVVNDLINILYLFVLCVTFLVKGYQTGRSDFFNTVLMQIYLSGVKTIPVAILLGLGVGVSVIVLTVVNVGEISGMKHVGRYLGILIIQDISPIITGFLLIVKSATACSTQIGIMKIQREIESMEAMGIHPVKYLILPKMIGGMVSFFNLNIVFITTAFLSGYYVINTMMTLPLDIFLSSVLNGISLWTMVIFVFKIGIGGAGIFLIASYYGLSVSSCVTEIPNATSNASLYALIFMFTFYTIVSLFIIACRI